AKALDEVAAARHRAERAPDAQGFLIVGLRAVVPLAVVEAGVHVTVVVGQVGVKRRAGVGRTEAAIALDKRRALEPITVDPFLGIDEGVLLNAETHPRL